MLSYSHHRPRAATVMRLRAAEPRTPASRKAGCEAHKSGFVRGAPARAGVPTRRARGAGAAEHAGGTLLPRSRGQLSYP